MKTINKTTYLNFDLRDFHDSFKNAELEVTYSSYPKEDELGIYGIEVDIEKVNVIMIDGNEPSDEQANVVLNLISEHEKELKEMIIDEEELNVD